MGQGGMRGVDGLLPAAGQNPERGGRHERGGHCTRNDRDERSDPVETVDLALTAGWHHVWAKFGRALQGCCTILGQVPNPHGNAFQAIHI